MTTQSTEVTATSDVARWVGVILGFLAVGLYALSIQSDLVLVSLGADSDPRFIRVPIFAGLVMVGFVAAVASLTRARASTRYTSVALTVAALIAYVPLQSAWLEAL